MSAIASFTDGHRTVLVVDTEAFDVAAVSFESAKIHLLPTLGAAFAVRGRLGSGLHLYKSILGTNIGPDALIEHMPMLMDGALEYADSLLEGDAEMRAKLEVILAAWSHDRGRMTLHHFRIENGGTQINRFIESALAPGGDFPLRDIEPTRQGMVELLGRQVRYLRAAHPDAASGGRFAACELTRDSISIEVVPGVPARTTRPGVRKAPLPDEALLQAAIDEAYSN